MGVQNLLMAAGGKLVWQQTVGGMLACRQQGGCAQSAPVMYSFGRACRDGVSVASNGQQGS